MSSQPLDQQTLATRWYGAVAPLVLEQNVTDVRTKLKAWSARLIELMQAETLNADPARSIGVAIARDLSAKPKMLSRTQQAVGSYLAELVDPDQSDRVFALVAGLASGFLEEKEAQIREIRGEFLSKTSHDMRSPLNGIIGFSRVILKGIDGPTTDLQEQDLNTIFESGKKLLDFINTVFNIEKIEAGRIDREVKSFNARKVVLGAVDEIRPMVKENENTLAANVDSLPDEMNSDPEKMRIVVSSLLARAARFTKGGAIAIQGSRTELDGQPALEIVVEDTGLGMTPTQVARFRDIRTQGPLQYGEIDLMLAQRYCQLMNGEMNLESSVNQGTKAIVLLPLDLEVSS